MQTIARRREKVSERERERERERGVGQSVNFTGITGVHVIN